ncbi:uncharacterized protein MKK02DRAFT_44482 [Dioszegia hungarica]|uniref:Uncharacterized protein n=1 Tax=Dioszegia hungarica TaxID=4972 RepID=A0AA38H8H3_9TREE|nr:uncharacterized protein MKK02DRAFT_44482 [Dioszegia hungarica]KAI9635782.1 hypothetical protein MKK02DRAFT_44482 [Dioszegia hungarica]
MTLLLNVIRSAARPVCSARAIPATRSFSLSVRTPLVGFSLGTIRSLPPAKASFHSSAARTGAWGPGLFECDHILDEVISVEEINGFPLDCFMDEWEGREDEARARLTRPHITSVMRKLTFGAGMGDRFPVNPSVVYIACCMRLGVQIYKKDLQLAERYVKLILRSNKGNDYILGQYRPLLQAIKDYKNDGETAWEPRELGLIATMVIGKDNAQLYRDGVDEDIILARLEAEKAEKEKEKNDQATGA